MLVRMKQKQQRENEGAVDYNCNRHSALRSLKQVTVSMGLEKCMFAAMNGFLKPIIPVCLTYVRQTVTDFNP